MVALSYCVTIQSNKYHLHYQIQNVYLITQAFNRIIKIAKPLHLEILFEISKINYSKSLAALQNLINWR